MKMRMPRLPSLLLVVLFLATFGQSPLAARRQTSEGLPVHAWAQENEEEMLRTSPLQRQERGWSEQDRLLPNRSLTDGEWIAVDSGTTESLMGVWGSSSSDVFAVSYEYHPALRWQRVEQDG
jgi:hypothetical protein